MQLTPGFLPPRTAAGRQAAQPVRRLRVELLLRGLSTFHDCHAIHIRRPSWRQLGQVVCGPEASSAATVHARARYQGLLPALLGAGQQSISSGR